MVDNKGVLYEIGFPDILGYCFRQIYTEMNQHTER